MKGLQIKLKAQQAIRVQLFLRSNWHGACLSHTANSFSAYPFSWAVPPGKKYLHWRNPTLTAKSICKGKLVGVAATETLLAIGENSGQGVCVCVCFRFPVSLQGLLFLWHWWGFEFWTTGSPPACAPYDGALRESLFAKDLNCFNKSNYCR